MTPDPLPINDSPGTDESDVLLGAPFDELRGYAQPDIGRQVHRRFVRAQLLRQTRALEEVAGESVSLPAAGGLGGAPGFGATGGGFRPELKDNLVQAQATAGENLFGDHLIPDTEGAIFRTTVSLDTTTSLDVVYNISGTPITATLNDGLDLDAGDLYIFDVPVTTQVGLNYRTGADCQVNVLFVHEVETAGP